MKPFQTTFRATLAVLFLLAGAVPGAGALPVAAAVPSVAASGDLLAFQLVTPGSGWAQLAQRLLWTADGGANWREITPPALSGAEIRAASFADAQYGWVVATTTADDGGLSYSLARTADGGETWQAAPMALFAAGEAAAMAGEVFLQFLDTNTGWLEVKQATSSNFNVGTLFRTVDGGQQWTRLSLPVGAEAHFTSALDGQIDATDTGNGRYVTHDGGRTWRPLTGASAPATGGPSGPKGERLSARSMATAQAGWARSQQGPSAAG